MRKTNRDEVEWTDSDHGDTAFRRKELSNAAGGTELGCSLYELPPGKRSWPYHYHTANEEALLVLEGMGTLRGEAGETPIRAGDYVSLPADASGGHQVVNDGDVPLEYLMISTMNEPDVTVYPESGKFGVFVGAAPGGRAERSLHGYYRIDDETSYWDE
ncbi:MAG: cupin domain-containing protein [Halobacteriales archaeon]|nr:cupin domain-containing protein [Halobacteriales archaeon]